MLPTTDYHMHTPLCGHAVGEPKAYAECAVSLGLKEIGFSDHAPMPHKVDPRVTMHEKQLPLYFKMIEEVQAKFKNKLTVKMALEADFIPGFENKTKEILKTYAFDYVIGSVHFIKDWGFDNPAEREKWDQKDINQVYRDYHELLRQSAKSKMFDIMGHVDLVKKFGHRPTIDVLDEVRKTAKVFKDSGVAVEINTSGARKPVGEMYPSLDNLEIYAEAGVPLTFGSDAHEPHHVGHDFEEAVEIAKAAGYKEYVIFTKRKIERKIKL